MTYLELDKAPVRHSSSYKRKSAFSRACISLTSSCCHLKYISIVGYLGILKVVIVVSSLQKKSRERFND